MKSTTVSDDTMQAQGLADFFENLGRKGFNLSNIIAKIVINDPGRALDFTAKIFTQQLFLNFLNQLYQHYQS